MAETPDVKVSWHSTEIRRVLDTLAGRVAVGPHTLNLNPAGFIALDGAGCRFVIENRGTGWCLRLGEAPSPLNLRQDEVHAISLFTLHVHEVAKFLNELERASRHLEGAHAIEPESEVTEAAKGVPSLEDLLEGVTPENSGPSPGGHS